MNEGGCSTAEQRARNNPQLAKLIVAGANELVNVQGEGTSTVHSEEMAAYRRNGCVFRAVT